MPDLTRKLDLLLINPGGRRQIYQKLGDDLAAKENPIWVGLLAEYARRKGLSVAVIDANAYDVGPREVGARVADIRPLLCAVVVYGHNPNASTHVMPAAGEIVAEIKHLDPTGKVILLGGHVAALPERTLSEETADFTCTGEGAVTLVELVAALRAGAAESDLAKVRGLCWHDGTQTRRNAPAPILTDLAQEMPQQAYDLLPMERYRAHNWHCFGGRPRQPYAALYTTLGCPFTCTFCCIQAPFKSGEAAAGLNPATNSYRRFAPAQVVAQIAHLVDAYGVNNIKLADELFVLDKQHVGAICDGLTRLDADLNIWAYARIDTCRDPALLDKLRGAGVRWLAIGIESAAEHVRAGVDKAYRPDSVTKAIAMVRKAGIHVVGNYIFGLPDDDHATMQQTLEFAKDLNTEYANFFSAMAYPGSQLYRDALQRGWRLPETWSGYSQHSRNCLPLPTKHLSGGEVLAFRDRAFHEYFERPAYREMMRRTFGHEATVEIQRMVAHKLPRDHVPTPAVVPGAP